MNHRPKALALWLVLVATLKLYKAPETGRIKLVLSKNVTQLAEMFRAYVEARVAIQVQATPERLLWARLQGGKMSCMCQCTSRKNLEVMPPTQFPGFCQK